MGGIYIDIGDIDEMGGKYVRIRNAQCPEVITNMYITKVVSLLAVAAWYV